MKLVIGLLLGAAMLCSAEDKPKENKIPPKSQQDQKNPTNAAKKSAHDDGGGPTKTKGGKQAIRADDAPAEGKTQRK